MNTQQEITALIQNAFATRGVELMNAANASADRKAERLRSLSAAQRAAMTRDEIRAFINA